MSGCYLFPVPAAARPPKSDLHETGNFPGNWALDFMAPGGSRVLAPVDGVITRWSGHDPATGVHPGAVFGWSIYLKGQDLDPIFITHLEQRLVKVGVKVCRGKPIGIVGHWPNDPGRSHCHLGVTAKTVTASKAEVVRIAAALKLRPV